MASPWTKTTADDLHAIQWKHLQIAVVRNFSINFYFEKKKGNAASDRQKTDDDVDIATTTDAQLESFVVSGRVDCRPMPPTSPSLTQSDAPKMKKLRQDAEDSTAEKLLVFLDNITE